MSREEGDRASRLEGHESEDAGEALTGLELGQGRVELAGAATTPKVDPVVAVRPRLQLTQPLVDQRRRRPHGDRPEEGLVRTLEQLVAGVGPGLFPSRGAPGVDHPGQHGGTVLPAREVAVDPAEA